MIKGIILDVDGVIVGGKKGYNWPKPNPEIIEAFKDIRAKGITISLCTGKGTFAINDIVTSANLDNVHIGDGGAVVVDILNNKIVDIHPIQTETVSELITTYQHLNTYMELYTLNGYFVQKNYVCDITEKHQAILYKEPFIVDSLQEVVASNEIVKVMPVARDEHHKLEVIHAFEPFQDKLSLQWGIHPTALPLQFGIITAQGISKKQAARVIAEATHVAFENILGVGDSLTDWEFIQLCGYAGAMGNASVELKEKVNSKDQNHGYIGKSVDENGLLDIFKHYQLI